MIGDQIKYGINNLRVRMLRTFLTMLGIAIAVATVTALVSLGLGLQVGINEQFEELGGNKIFIQGEGFGAGSQDVAGLDRSDAEFVEKIAGVSIAYGGLFDGLQVEYDDQVINPLAFGVPTNEYSDFFEESFQLEVIDGRYLRSGDSKKVLLGYRYSQDNDLFDEAVQLRDNIIINDVKFQVVGFIQEFGNPADDRQLYLTEDDMRELLDEPEKISLIFGEIANIEEAEQLSETIERRLRVRLGQKEGEETFNVQTSEQLIESFSNVLNILVGFIISVGLISLVVGAINITNTMYTAVIERTKEIGTIKAIGGRNVTIQNIFLIEAGLIGIGGGVLGTLIGMLVAYAGATVVDAAGFGVLKFFFPQWLWMLGVGFAVIMSLISGYLPSRQASRMKPVDALRYE